MFGGVSHLFQHELKVTMSSNKQQPDAKVEAGRTKPASSTRTRFQIRIGNASIVKSPSFEVCCAYLKGYVFNLSGIQNADSFSDNLRKVTQYVVRYFTQGSNI